MLEVGAQHCTAAMVSGLLQAVQRSRQGCCTEGLGWKRQSCWLWTGWRRRESCRVVGSGGSARRPASALVSVCSLLPCMQGSGSQTCGHESKGRVTCGSSNSNAALSCSSLSFLGQKASLPLTFTA